MNHTHFVPVRLSEHPYEIVIEAGMLQNGVAAERLKVEIESEPLVFVTHPALQDRYVLPTVQRLEADGIRCVTLLLRPGEKNKTWSGVGRLLSGLAGAGVDRRGLIVAAGGGVLGDMVGFAASAYLRGVRFVQVPTTLLAQVDASVGGKTGVDLPEGKNLAGAFHQPSTVLIDPDTLASLPLRELRSGLSEVVKYGIIWEGRFLSRLQELRPALLKRDPQALAEIIRVCCEIKAEVVRQDERESSLRAILNFGHTVGHALEAATGYKVYKHGEAIALGMMAESLIGESLGITPMETTAQIETLLTEFGLKTAFPADFSEDLFFRAMRRDKKTLRGEFKFVIPEKIGRVQYGVTVSEEQVRRVLFSSAR